MEDHDYVVRGGKMASEGLRVNAQQTKDVDDFFGISVWSSPGLSVAEIATLAEIKHGKIRVSTVGRIREAGFEIISTPRHGEGHCDILLMDVPDEETCEVLRDLFCDERPNPSSAGRN